MPVMPYIAILGLPFLRDITDWYHSSSSITNQNKVLTNKGSHDPFLIQLTQQSNNNNRSVVEAPSLGSQTMLTMGDDPSCHRLPAVHHAGSPPHSLAIGIAREKSHEYSFKYSQTHTNK